MRRISRAPEHYDRYLGPVLFSDYADDITQRAAACAPGRVVQTGDRYQIDGMAWGPHPISTVEVKIDNGPWQKAKLDGIKAIHMASLDVRLEADTG